MCVSLCVCVCVCERERESERESERERERERESSIFGDELVLLDQHTLLRRWDTTPIVATSEGYRIYFHCVMLAGSRTEET